MNRHVRVVRAVHGCGGGRPGGVRSARRADRLGRAGVQARLNVQRDVCIGLLRICVVRGDRGRVGQRLAICRRRCIGVDLDLDLDGDVLARGQADLPAAQVIGESHIQCGRRRPAGVVIRGAGDRRSSDYADVAGHRVVQLGVHAAVHGARCALQPDRVGERLTRRDRLGARRLLDRQRRCRIRRGCRRSPQARQPHAEDHRRQQDQNAPERSRRPSFCHLTDA